MPIPGVKVLEDPSARRLYSIDQGEPPAALRSRFVREADMVAQPTTVEEIGKVLAHARAQRIPVVPRGVASSGFGATLPTRGGIVLDLSWLRRILAVDPAARTARVEAGVRWSDLARALEPHGLALRTYPSNAFSTIGGWIATGGCGIGSVRYGPLRDSVKRLRVLLPSGEDRDLRPGEALFDAFFGSDGQLGVVVEIDLELREAPAWRRPVLLTFPDDAAAIAFLRLALDAGVAPYHANLWNATRMREKNHLLHRQDFPEKTSLLLYLETRGHEEKLRALGAPEPAPLWQAQLSWEDRFYPIRAKKLGPGLLAAELMFPLERVAGYFAAAEAMGHERGYEVVAEAQIAGRDRAVVIVSFLYDSRDGKESFHAGAFAMRLAVLGLASGGVPYNLGLWYSPFAELKFGERWRELRDWKRTLDPAGRFNPGKSLGRLWAYTAALELWRRLPWLPGRFRKGASRHEEPREFSWKTSWEVCSKCAACVAHCPAVLAVGDERVSARGKMFLLAHLDELRADEAQLVFQCMHCKYCTEVCQSEIRLEDAFFDLEKAVEARFGRPEAPIRAFLDRVAQLDLMENVPMADPEPPWRSAKLMYDDVTGSISRNP